MHNAIRSSTRSLVCAATIGASVSAAWATTPSFTLLGELRPGVGSEGTGISGDGSAATGSSHEFYYDPFEFEGFRGFEAFRWNAPVGLLNLGELPGATGYTSVRAWDASFDGAVVVGGYLATHNAIQGTQAFIWTETNGIARLLEPRPHGLLNSEAYAVNGDGTIVVGTHQYSGQNRGAFVWTSELGMVPIGALAQIGRSEARDISTDGLVVVGSVGGTDSDPKAAKWTAQAGWAILGDIPGGPVGPSRARAVNADGSIIVGQQGPSDAHEAFLWTPATGPVSLGALPNGYSDADATGVSLDGSLIVGSAKATDNSRVAMIWAPFTGWAPMTSTLKNIVGIHVLGTIIDSPSLSDDGRTIVASAAGWKPSQPGSLPPMACRIVLPGPGACCIGGGCVDDLDPIVCSSFCGVFVSDEQTCATLACESFGACVFQCSQNAAAPCPDGIAAVFPGCVALAEADCDAAGGLFVGGDCNCRESFDPCPTDVNGDGATNITDFNVLASNFGQGNPDCRTPWEGDLTCDGVVDISDFNILAGDFGCGN